MPLTIGSRIGPYEVLSPLGAGGMGEVFRARDTKLDRLVAIKILPDSFARDPDRLARFEREAKTLAALNHPNIGGIYGLEESNGIRALVLELVEGPTLADRIAQGPVPIDEALPVARQIAEALEAAHEQGIVHRDLKPANIKVRPDGTVKVLDFGLAKALDPIGVASGASQSPTIATPAMTQGGIILGTAAYMSPEQARGKIVDKRSDIWAFGCVLFEMLAGRRAFDGEDAAVVLASVIKGEPDWAALPADVPRPIVTLLGGCLEKERHRRISDISTATFVLTHAAQLVERVEGSVALRPAAAHRPPVWRRVMPAGGALCIGALLAGAGTWFMTRPAPPSVVRATITTSGPTALRLSAGDRDIAITPDGSRIVYASSNQVLVRALDRLEPRVLSGGFSPPGPRGFFISPDGQSVGFSTETR